MKNIIDFYSRQQIGKLNPQNHKENDALTTEYGHVWVIFQEELNPQNDADSMKGEQNTSKVIKIRQK